MTNCSVIAFHGAFASPSILMRDMGNPAWVDRYFAGRDVSAAERLCRSFARVVLVGYSYGGQVIAELSHRLQNLIGAVVYESPVKRMDHVGGDFPVLMAWNRNGSRWRPHAKRSMKLWAQGRDCTAIEGEGRHVRFVWGWPPIGHAWDKSLNPAIQRWIRQVRACV